MKIDESSINHNALRLISESVSELYDFTGQTDAEDHIRLVALGEIRGITVFAEELKKLLRA